ncbi:MAG TPA: glycosyltransferase family 4 protein, partial [Chloroflexota bacterium]|nr:glycosyltransferase family 4 protein [Chloroflexota bacterium]
RHVPLGDQLDAPPPPDYSRGAWRARFGVAPDTPLVAHFGLINQSKGVRELVRALTELPDAHLLLIGETLGGADPTNAAYLDAVRTDVERLGPASRVHWTGYVTPPELSGWLATADAVALPFLDGATLRRTSLITAWRRGVPVITTEPPGPAEWRSSPPGSDAARYVPAGDVDALAAALRDVLASPARRASLAQNGREFGERFSWPSVIAQTLAVYEAALSVRRA